jgi:hypothetical protein
MVTHNLYENKEQNQIFNELKRRYSKIWGKNELKFISKYLFWLMVGGWGLWRLDFFSNFASVFNKKDEKYYDLQFNWYTRSCFTIGNLANMVIFFAKR